MREYATPAGFRAAVEATLRDRARRLGVPAYIIRRQAALERVIVRLTKVAPNRWAVKGGMALETRLGEHARVSVDLDADHARVDARLLKDVIRRVFDRRATHPVPDRLPPPLRELAVSYRREAERVGLPTNLDDVHRLLGAWLDPILSEVRSR